MRKTTKQIYSILFLLIFTITGKVFAEDITDISGRKYYPAVKEILDNSEASIFMVMYIVNMDEKNTKSNVYQLFNIHDSREFLI